MTGVATTTGAGAESSSLESDSEATSDSSLSDAAEESWKGGRGEDQLGDDAEPGD